MAAGAGPDSPSMSNVKYNSTAPHAKAVANPIVYQPSNADDLTKHPKYHSLL